ncbi:TetR/AcrR family transcriptional regulator [Streptomyces sp. FH025]|uniref:TetR/AcrR family transcriptional regulator n=1 Tax=Streptomyces sp. FH025 TaxID=2815937 RepID=UPI001A9FBA10|nr:TetR/AcrR family transcriptional regulator C-terminal domain-containing protein [Streptomyces sp. FH025]MBO1413560.1 TetR/AcrR family transcriptional regulator C-terminal domain-containing protein [Streptomyces sp. FH025]
MGSEGNPGPTAGRNEKPASPDRARLSRPRVLRAAVALVDREGLAALTMRSLASDLGVEPMALYRYAAGKEALLDGMVEAFYVEVNDSLDAEPEPVRPDPDSGVAWRAEVHRIARAFHRVADAHPELFPLVATRPLTVPLARRSTPMLRLNERLLTVLGQAGYDDHSTLRVYRAVVGWVLGYLLVDKRQVVDNPDEPEPLLRLGLHRLPAAEYPRLRALASLLADHDPAEELTAGLDVLLDRIGNDAIAD